MVRQYQQFMALMNNYDYFKENVSIAEESTGTLQKQADIYAESWEAASKRVRASAESLYQDLIDDKFFISINNGIANVLSGLDAFIDKAGGLKTVITAVSGVFLSTFASKIPDAIKTVKYNLEVLTGGSQKVYQNIFKEMQESTNKAFSENKIDPNSSMGLELKMTNALTLAKNKYIQTQDQLSEAEKQSVQTKLAILEASKQEIILEQQKNEEAKKTVEERKNSLGEKEFYNWNNKGITQSQKAMDSLNHSELNNFKDAKQKNQVLKSYEDFSQSLKNYQKTIPVLMRQLNKEILNSMDNTGNFTKGVNPFKGLDSSNGKDQLSLTFKRLKETAILTSKSISDNFAKELEALQKSLDPTTLKLSGLDDKFKDFIETAKKGVDSNQAKKMVKELENSLKNAEIPAEKLKEALSNWHGEGGIVGLISTLQKISEEETNIQGKTDVLIQQLKEFNIDHIVSFSEGFAGLASGIMNAYTALQSIKSIFASINDTSLNLWETLTSVFSGITSLLFVLLRLKDSVSIVAGGIKSLGAAIGSVKIASLSAAATMGIAALAIAGVAGMIAFVISLIKKAKENSPEGQLEKAKKATEELTEQVNEAKQAYSELQSTIESYKTAKSNLDGLKTGTIEFTDALIEANEKAWELIRTLGLTEGKGYTIGENGVITINFDSSEVEQAIHNKQEQLEDKQAGLSNVSTAQYQKQYEVERSQRLDRINYDEALSEDDVLNNLFKAFKVKEGGESEIVKRLLDESNSMGGDFSQETIREFGKVLGYGDDVYTSMDGMANGNAISAIRDFLDTAKSGYFKFTDLYSSQRQSQMAIQQNTAQSLMQALSNEEAYQNSKYGGQIAAAVAKATTEELTNELKSAYADKTDDEINSAFETWARNNGSYVENGKIYTDSSKQTEIYSNYTRENKENVLIGTDITSEQETDALGKINKLNNAMANVSKNLKPYAEALASGGDITKLTQEQIKYIKSHGGKIESILGTSFDSIASVFGDSWQDFIDKINNAIKTYKPGDEFDLDSWKQNYNKVWEKIGKLQTGGTIDGGTYNLLSDEAKAYFKVQEDGTYLLTGKAEELKQVVQSIDTQKLKDTISEQHQWESNAVKAYGDAVKRDNISSDYITQVAQGIIDKEGKGYTADTGAYRGLKEATGMADEDLAQYDTDAEKIQAMAQAWLDFQESLTANENAAAQAAKSVAELDKNLADGTIDAEEYKNAIDGAIKAEAEANNIDYSDVVEYAEVLKKVNDALKDNDKLAKQMSLAYLKVQKGVKTISSSYNDWNKAIKNNKKDITQYLKTVDEIKDVYKQVFNDVDSKAIENLSDEFLTSAKTMELMNKAVNGSEQDWNNWEAAVLAEINNTSTAFSGMTQTMKDSMTELTTMAANLDFSGLVPGADINDAPFRAKLNEMIFSTADAAQAMSDNLSSVGVDAEVQEYTYTVPPDQSKAIQTGNIVAFAPDGSHITVPISAEVEQADEGKTFKYYALKGAKYNGRGVRPAAATPVSSGGGGGSKSTSHADTKSFSDKDRYHTVKNQLEDLNAQYDALDEAKDRAFGKSKIKEMDAEIAKTDELINKQKEYLREIEDYLPKDKAIMEKAYNEYIGGPGIEYDALGNISNFDTIQDAMFNKYNEMAGAYTDDSDEWKVFEKKYELLEKYIEQYEETYDLLRDERDKMQELINQKIDLGLEKVQYQVEVALEVPDDAIKVLEYRIGRIDDDAEKSLEAVSLLTKKAEQVYDKIQLNKQALNDVLKLSMSVSEINEVLAGNTAILAGKTFTEDQIDALKDYRDALIDLNGEFDDIRDSIEGKVMDVFDKWRDKLNTGIDTIEHYGNTLSSFHNIIDIVGKETLGITGDLMNKLVQSTVDVAIDKLKGTKRTYETIMASRDEAERRLQEAQARNDEASVKLWQENLETINEEVRSANEEMMQAWEDALSSIADNFENTVNDLVDTFQKSVYALGGLDGLSDDFSRQQENADLMLDDYQKIYELSKLSRDINKTIDDTDIISGKQKLKKLLGQINDLQADGNEMSKYDLEYLQKTYDLRLAEIELEEAQRAKNTVRLQKDSEGNWSYIYTQSSDAIDSAQQKYEDALYAMQDLSSNYIDEMSEKLISTSKDMEEALAAIRIQDYASIDDYYAEVERVQNQYQEQMDMQQNELQKAIDNNKELYDTDWTNYHNATGYKISDTEDFVTSFKDSLLGTLMDSKSDTANFTDIIGDSVYNLTLGLMQAAETYYKNIEDAMNAAGTSTGNFAEDAGENIDKVVEKSHEGTDAINDMANQMTSAFDAITESVGAWQENYGMAMEKIIQSNLDVVESFNNMIANLSIGPDDITIKYDITNSAKDQKAKSFDTGGYTGEWGTAGKLAVLHQKEMVLNENDTANMLAVVQFTRSILDTIDINAKAASLGLGAMTATSLKEDKQETLRQEVHITAEFPNVNDHNEIEEAFNNLINQASQYVNRK